MRRLLRRLLASFTLIEMLVVIAIIGILAGMLLPALARAREEARKADCKNNLHNISLALHMYADGNGGYYPWCWTSASSTGHSTDSLALLFPELIPITETFRCKSIDDRPAITVTDGQWVAGEYIGGSKKFGTDRPTWSSYGYDSGIALRNTHPMRPVCADMDGSSVTNPSSVTANHQGGQNVLFYDGHVEWKTVNTWINPWWPDPGTNKLGCADNYFVQDLYVGDTDALNAGDTDARISTDAWIRRP